MSSHRLSGAADELSPPCFEPAHTPRECSPLAHHTSQASCILPHSLLRSRLVDHYATNFDCNVCLRVCRDPVVTMCGHLFCWPCLYHWLSLHSASKQCPVCRADVQDKIVPLYGCGRDDGSTVSSTDKLHGVPIPCRPSVIAPITHRSASHHRSQHNHATQHNEVHTTAPSAHSGFCALLLRRLGLVSLPPQDGGFIGRYAHSAASLLMCRRRFSNEKEFVLHWVFIVVASATAAFFLAC